MSLFFLRQHPRPPLEHWGSSLNRPLIIITIKFVFKIHAVVFRSHQKDFSWIGQFIYIGQYKYDTYLYWCVPSILTYINLAGAPPIFVLASPYVQANTDMVGYPAIFVQVWPMHKDQQRYGRFPCHICIGVSHVCPMHIYLYKSGRFTCHICIDLSIF